MFVNNLLDINQIEYVRKDQTMEFMLVGYSGRFLRGNRKDWNPLILKKCTELMKNVKKININWHIWMKISRWIWSYFLSLYLSLSSLHLSHCCMNYRIIRKYLNGYIGKSDRSVEWTNSCNRTDFDSFVNRARNFDKRLKAAREIERKWVRELERKKNRESTKKKKSIIKIPVTPEMKFKKRYTLIIKIHTSYLLNEF